MCIIIGLEKFISSVENGEKKLEEILKKAEELENFSFIIVDSASKIKAHEYDPWYKTFVTNDNGIWIGNGINDQYLLNISSYGRKLDNNCGNNFGYVIQNGEPNLVKLIEMKENGDEDE